MTDGWAPSQQGSEYPDERQFIRGMPVANPVASRAAVRKRRKSPGLPSSCEKCLWSKSGCCGEHRDSYEESDPLSGVEGAASRASVGRAENSWHEVVQ